MINPKRMSDGRIGGLCSLCDQVTIPLLTAIVPVKGPNGWVIQEGVICLSCIPGLLVPETPQRTSSYANCPSCNETKCWPEGWRNVGGKGIHYVCGDCFKETEPEKP